jgi:hypothetical protein
MDFRSQNTQPFSGEPPEEFSSIFGLPNSQNAVYPQGLHENTFDHQQNISVGNHMPPYNGSQVVGEPCPQWGGPSHTWNHPNINANETYDLDPVSNFFLLITNYISYLIVTKRQ